MPEEPVIAERLIKSTQRVRDLGEVFTPSSTVQDMLDLLPSEIWAVHPSPTFLEPSCGDGNFLVAVFDRKAAAVVASWKRGTLPYGADRKALLFHLLEALSSVYGVDICPENIDGNPDENHMGARERLLGHFQNCSKEALGRKLPESDSALAAARWIIRRNVQVGNMLPIDQMGRYIGNPRLPLLEYVWHSGAGTVKISTTTFADVADGAAPVRSGEFVLVSERPEPAKAWEGPFERMTQAPVPEPICEANKPRNGRRSATT